MRRINLFLNHVEECLGVFSLLFTSILVFIQVVMRYFFNYSLFWSEEVARYIIIWFIFIGSSIAVREKAHAVVDALVTFLPSMLKRVFSIFASLIAIIFCVFIIYSGWLNIANVIQYQSVTPSLGIPLYIPYLAIPVGSALMLIRLSQLIWDDLKHLRTLDIEGEGN